ncbi:MAG TPA: thioesterase family protein [Thermoanaerobaculia bacterium]|nr:thioesterase family protein [Thermoanaerobaculia bacterium]
MTAVHDYRTRRRVEFADTDLSGLVHFARFFVFMETAEHEFLRSLGVDPGALLVEDGRLIGWPRAAASCEYLAPAHYGEELEIHLQVERVGRTSLTFSIAISRGATAVARGKVTTVCCVLNEPSGPRPVPIPATLARRLRATS